MIHGNGSVSFERFSRVVEFGNSEVNIVVSLKISLGFRGEFIDGSPGKSYSSIRSDRMRGVMRQIESAVDIDYRNLALA